MLLCNLSTTHDYYQLCFDEIIYNLINRLEVTEKKYGKRKLKKVRLFFFSFFPALLPLCCVETWHSHSQMHLQTMASPQATPGWLRSPALFLFILYTVILAFSFHLSLPLCLFLCLGSFSGSFWPTLPLNMSLSLWDSFYPFCFIDLVIFSPSFSKPPQSSSPFFPQFPSFVFHSFGFIFLSPRLPPTPPFLWRYHLLFSFSGSFTFRVSSSLFSDHLIYYFAILGSICPSVSPPSLSGSASLPSAGLGWKTLSLISLIHHRQQGETHRATTLGEPSSLFSFISWTLCE